MLYLVGFPLYVMGAACYMGVMNALDQKYHFTDPVIFLIMVGALVWPVMLLPVLYFAGIMCGCYYITKGSNKISAQFLRKFFFMKYLNMDGRPKDQFVIEHLFKIQGN